MKKQLKHHTIRLASVLLLAVVCSPQIHAIDIPATALLPSQVDTVIPIGETTGIKLKSEGVMVVGLTDGEGQPSPAGRAGLKKGDIIEAVGGKTVLTGSELLDEVAHCEGKPLELTVRRGDSKLTARVTPECTADGGYRIGVLVRDSLMGIGTITFYEPKSGVYGALGHGISDPDSGALVPIADGNLIPSTVSEVTKGEVGTPGELHGNFQTEKESGSVEKNVDTGIYGHLELSALYKGKQSVPVAKNDEIKEGKAQILSTVGANGAKLYDITILKLNEESMGTNKNMLIEVTDPKLLGVTGGIVQGMSGSPILQNGKIVGAVTHVLVNDPTRGYGIFIENMLESAA